MIPLSNYVKGREFAPKGEEWDKAEAYWKTLYSATKMHSLTSVLSFNAEDIEPMITYGTNPGMGIGVTQHVPVTEDVESNRTKIIQKLPRIYGLCMMMKQLLGKPIDYVFIGSCTNSRIEDLRQVAAFVKGRHKADHVTVWVVPGSKQVQQQAIAEGLGQGVRSRRLPTPRTGLQRLPGYERGQDTRQASTAYQPRTETLKAARDQTHVRFLASPLNSSSGSGDREGYGYTKNVSLNQNLVN
jgi:3-isopropylmalate/(R)-2-methylmalate dehydratase large subunit